MVNEKQKMVLKKKLGLSDFLNFLVPFAIASAQSSTRIRLTTRSRVTQQKHRQHSSTAANYNLLIAVVFILLLFSFYSCTKKTDTTPLDCELFSIKEFNPLVNWKEEEQGKKTISLDYTDAINGFTIPSLRQLENGKFEFEFEIKNNTRKPQQFFYKIYYQNESYKFEEEDSVTHKKMEFAEENFYGSWTEASVTFKQTEAIASDNIFYKISDVFAITGNPRNEERYIKDGINNRWQRNPRMGDYSFLLVVSTREELSAIPESVQQLNKKENEHFLNPYYYFLYGKGKELKKTIACKSATVLKVTAQPNLGGGIYINSTSFSGVIDTSAYCATCGHNSNLYKNAPIQQFINYVDASTKMENIPVLADILSDNYSKMDYNWNRNFYTKEELIPAIIQTSKKPCTTVISDPDKKKISIKNPKTTYGEWKKESVGIITRHGLTYGKYRVKVKLTELLNKNNVWNGLTNAIWLISQGGGEWNYRRNCNKEGYMASYWGGSNDKRVPAVDYSEIDFEILKTPPYCPDNAFPPVFKNTSDDKKNINSWNVQLPDEITNADDKVTVACTNWDMACREPEKFAAGCNPISYKGQTFYTHRWDNTYRALTEKKEENDDELFGSGFYYFEIEWRPTEIIWRIGPQPDKMRVVGYMNDQVTSIPNNQMLLIITQEYHNTKWWPGAPYSQDNLPFPANDIPGEIYELTVE